MSSTAALAFAFWPFVALVLYSTLPARRATMWNFLGAQMFLPTGAIKFPVIVPFDKASIPTLCAIVLLLVWRPDARSVPGSKFANFLLFCYVIAPIATSLLNTDAIVNGGVLLPGVGIYDGLSAAETALVAVLPFVIGRVFFRETSDVANILRALAFAGLIYSVLMLIEIRLSPQLHYWVYGYYSSDFEQSARGDSYRPIVFMGNGLLATFFLMTTAVSAAAFWRNKVKLIPSVPASVLLGYLSFVLILCRSLGSLVYAATAIPLLRFTSARTCVRVSAIFALLALAYPLLRSQDFVPTEGIVSLTKQVSEERSRSIEFRFINEDKLLHRASQRPLFGWGRFSRSRVYDEESGRDLSVTDGRWIITMGQFGLFGFVAEFGLLSLGVFSLFNIWRKAKPGAEAGTYVAALSLLVALNIVDLLPNASVTPLTFLLSGSLLGHAEAIASRLKSCGTNKIRHRIT
ncbi:hypothetical protein [Bradyrhizobium sp. Tv2a-2]|uniref:hypothetical protein n=1 Tax=Bradyrhizobium sp. Tv2a-2 TaxID=113395 RepID=UPI0004676DB4|nr:hypothetical protein [Bradyrhizobium sp. Tv2a-2]